MTGSSTDVLRFGVLGTARIAPKALIGPVRQQEAAVVTAIGSRDGAAARAFADEHGIPHAYGSYEQLISSDQIDAVYVALPASMHAEWAIAALEQGKHVLCEKPLASNGDEARVMAEVADRRGLLLAEAMHSLHHPLFDRIRSLVGSGQFGPVTTIMATFSTPITPPNIRWDPELSGGALMDLGSYPISWIRALVDTDPIAVEASAQSPDGFIDAAIEASLTFPGGSVARLESSMTVDSRVCSLEVVMESGVLCVENPIAPQLGNRLRLQTAARTTETTVLGGVSYEHMVRNFVEHVAHRAPFVPSVSTSVANMTTIDAIYEAAGLPRRGISASRQ